LVKIGPPEHRNLGAFLPSISRERATRQNLPGCGVGFR